MVARAIAHPEETWGRARAADPARDLSSGLTRLTLGAFLHSDGPKDWLAARRMAVTITPGIPRPRGTAILTSFTDGELPVITGRSP
jgi:hypothetical protein